MELIRHKEHLTLEGLNEIVSYKAAMNLGLPNSLKEIFKDVIPKDRPAVNYTNNLAYGWIAGFTSAEGSFMIRILNSPEHKFNKKVQLEFNITQHARDEKLMKIIAEYFDTGSISLNRNTFMYRVVSYSELTKKIFPFFNNYPVQGIKSFDYIDFLKAVYIIKEKRHLTKEGLEEIQQIKNGMNSRRNLI